MPSSVLRNCSVCSCPRPLADTSSEICVRNASRGKSMSPPHFRCSDALSSAVNPRTTDFQVFFMEGLTVYLAFSSAAWWLGQKAFLYNHAGFVRLAIPTALIALGLLLSNAYADPAKQRGWAQCVFECAGCISVAFLAASFAVPFEILLYGSGTSLVLLSTLRMLFPPILSGPSSIALSNPQTPIKWKSAILVAAVFAIVVFLAIRR